MLASLFGRSGMVRLLRERGANTMARNRWGFSAGLLGLLPRIVAKLRHPFRPGPLVTH